MKSSLVKFQFWVSGFGCISKLQILLLVFFLLVLTVSQVFRHDVQLK